MSMFLDQKMSKNTPDKYVVGAMGMHRLLHRWALGPMGLFPNYWGVGLTSHLNNGMAPAMIFKPQLSYYPGFRNNQESPAPRLKDQIQFMWK